ncbi:uncharacterized protein LOC126304739 [Schistocerca gregaria]|uniref:uncharacterized protein LOC126304739 n=1 Tax=Schistocerca gregaria TaxID=7010 RepID=UPI00211DA594|nr:uncharacterized protein LOC126304739 [Schistocerca gregaria]
MIKLTKINVSSNSLSGQISQFRDNNQLVSVDLSNNGFSGKIPSFERNTKLVYLNLSMNLFSEMKSFSRNINLETLDVSSNKITIGGDVQTFENNIRLSILNMSQNGFIRVSEINAPNLLKLDISSCQLNNITNFELKKLEYLNLSHNRLNQEVPDTKELPKLSELYLHHNQLTGELSSFKFNSELSKLIFHIIDYQARFHNSIEILSCQNCTFKSNISMLFINLSNNQLSDNIPSFIRHEKLVMLDLSYNKLSGQFPVININIRELRLNGNADLRYSCKEDILRDTYLNHHVCDLGTIVIISDTNAECAKNVNVTCKANLLSGTEPVYYIGILQILVVATGLMLIY